MEEEEKEERNKSKQQEKMHKQLGWSKRKGREITGRIYTYRRKAQSNVYIDKWAFSWATH